MHTHTHMHLHNITGPDSVQAEIDAINISWFNQGHLEIKHTDNAKFYWHKKDISDAKILTFIQENHILLEVNLSKIL